MKSHDRWSPLRCRERGAALPMALAFLVLFAVLMGLIFDFIGTGMASNAALKGERNDLYTVNGAVDAAISKIQNDPTLGLSGGDAQCALNSTENGATANVTCAPSSTSGTTVNTTSAPPFAILTTAPFTANYNDPHNPSCSTISTAPGAELGVIQFQKDKLLRVTGNVYVNSDVDADVWSNGCPEVRDALAIQVNGDVKVREACNDMYPVATTYLWLCSSQGVHTPVQAPRQTDGAASASDPSFTDPAIANPTSWAPEITSPPPVQSVPSCPANNNVVKFLPGTYNDAAAMSALMNGISCPGRTFWFSPGVYYFDFANGGVNGNHEWRINDSNGKVVAGQPNAVPSGSTPVGPVPVTATGASTSSPGFTGPTDAILIGGNLATTGNFSTSGQQRWLRANGYSMAQSPIPPGSSAPVVQLHVVHGESWDTAGSSGTVTGWVTPNAPTPTAGNPCATIPTGSALASTPFCLSADARTNNNTGAVARFANAGTTARSITLANGWAGSALPGGCDRHRCHRAGEAPRVDRCRRDHAVAVGYGQRWLHDHIDEPPAALVEQQLRHRPGRAPRLRQQRNLLALVAVQRELHLRDRLPDGQHERQAGTARQHRAHRELHGAGAGDAAVRQRAGASSEQRGQREPLHRRPGTDRQQQHRRRNHPRSGRLLVAGRAQQRHVLAPLSGHARDVHERVSEHHVAARRHGAPRELQRARSLGVGSERPRGESDGPGGVPTRRRPLLERRGAVRVRGDSRVYLQSGQVELCNAPSTTHQEIVLYQVKKGTAATNGTQAGWRAATATPSEPAGPPCPTSLPAAGSAPFCVPSDALSLNGTGAISRFAGVIPAATPEVQAINLAGGWTGTALPAGAQVTGVSALVRHREAGSGGAIALALSGSAGGGCAITTQTVTPVTGASLGDQTFTLPACVNTNLANLSLDYTASYSCAGPTVRRPPRLARRSSTGSSSRSATRFRRPRVR